jgi:hypothetical protein
VKKEKVARPGPSTSFFVDVPRNAAVLTVDSTGGRLTAIDPLGRRSSAPAGRKTVTYPMAGVWELGVFLTNDALDLAWGATGGEIAPPVAVSVTTGVLTAQITAPPEVALTAGASRPVEVTVVNEQAKFDGGLAAMPMGSVRTATERLRPREQRVYEVRVPEGSPFLMAQVTNPSAQDAEIDIYFFDCTGKRCTRPAAALGLGSAPRLRHESPKAGLWRIVVDAARVPADGLAFEYADIVADPALGSVSVTDASVSRDAGTRWTATANVWLAKRPDGDRRPYALLVVNAATKDGAAPAGFRMIPVQAAAGSAAR